MLESRRAGLERWLQEVLAIQPTPEQLLDFLQVAAPGHLSPAAHLDESFSPFQSCSVAVLAFTADPFLPCEGGSSPQTTVEAGVLAALYDKALRLPR